MNVLIVDDEPIIRTGMRSMLDWDSAGLCLVGEAEDGEEAWTLIGTLGVDLVITDLLMPRMDGLELLRKIRESDRDVSSIVLSCMDDFVWVKEAMKLGAKDYILKPTMEPEQLLHIMMEAKQELEERRIERDRVLRLRQELNQTKQAKLNAKLQAYLVNGQADAQLEQELFGNGKLLYSMLFFHKGELSSQVELGWETLGFHAAASLETEQVIMLFEETDPASYHDAAYWIRGQQLIDRIELLLEHEFKKGQEAIPFDWFIGTGVRAGCMDDLALVQQWHARQLHDRFYNGTMDRIVMEPTSASLELPLPIECRSDLLRAVAHENTRGYQFHAKELGERLAIAKRPIAEVTAFVADILTLTASYARESGSTYAEQFERQYVHSGVVRRCATIEQVQKLLVRAYGELGMQRVIGPEQTTASRTSSPFVKKAVQFMRDQYHRNISTADIAEHVKLSRSYLSDLYSKDTGESLSETLTFIRMEAAKKKLRSGEMKVYEIAEAVGFPDSKTFLKTFKRIVGCTPKEYELSNK